MEDDIFNGYADITELQEAREKERLGFVRRSSEVVAPEGTVMAEEAPSEMRDPLSPSMQDVAIPEDGSIESYITRLGQTWYNALQSGAADIAGTPGELESLGRGIFQLVTNLGGETAAEAWKRGVGDETLFPKIEEVRSGMASIGIEPVGDFSEEDLKAQKELGSWVGLGGGGALAGLKAKKFMDLGKRDYGTETPVDFDRQVEPLPLPPMPIKAQERSMEAVNKFKGGLISGDELADTIIQIDNDIAQKKYISEMHSQGKPRPEGQGQVGARIYDAFRKAEIDPETKDLAIWFIEQNPAITDGLAASVLKSTDTATGGMYDPVSRIAAIFKGTHSSTTPVHEILHHSERMMPTKLRNNIAKLWKDRFVKELNNARAVNDETRYNALIDQLMSRMGDKDAGIRTAQNYESGILKYDRDYQFTNPSEFWTVNATEIFAKKHKGKDATGFAAVKRDAGNYLKKLKERLKETFNLDSDHYIYEGIEKVLTGKQIEEGRMLGGTRYLGEVLSERQSGAL